MSPRILLLRALGLGDFLTGVPAYRAVRRAFPGHQLVLAAPAPVGPLVPLTRAIDKLLPVGELQPVPWTGPAPDVAIDLHGRGPASHRLVAALRPRRLIVFGGEHGGGFTGPVWQPDEHEVVRWCRLCQESGIPADPGDLLLTPPRQVTPAFTLLHPGAAAPGRRWPAARFAAVGRRLAADGHDVRITGSAAERDRVGPAGDLRRHRHVAPCLGLRAPVGDPLRPRPAVRMGTAPVSAASGALGGGTRLSRRPACLAR